jgi:hypothetical protein
MEQIFILQQLQRVYNCRRKSVTKEMRYKAQECETLESFTVKGAFGLADNLGIAKK